MGNGPLALIGSRAKLMQHWADRIDYWLDPRKVTPIDAARAASANGGHTLQSCRMRH